MTVDDLPLSPQEQDDALAAEYVLGVLSLPDRIAAETRAAKDRVFAARITAWENRLADLNDGFEAEPAPNLMPQIEARLFGTPAPKRRPLFGWLAGALTAAAVAIAAVAFLASPRSDFTTGALLHGDVPRHLDFDPREQPLALQQQQGRPPQVRAQVPPFGLCTPQELDHS